MVVPNVAGKWQGFSAVNIRMFVLGASRLSDLVELVTPRTAACREASARPWRIILMVGGTQDGSPATPPVREHSYA